MKYFVLAALVLVSVSHAFAEEEKKLQKLEVQTATTVTVDPPVLQNEADQALFERVRSAYARAVGRGTVHL